MVKAFERVTGQKIPYEIVDRRPGDLATVYASPDRSAQLLGWKAEYDIDKMCFDAANWQMKNPDGFGE
jgi:UDP-glucose 4-epimerase